MIQTNPSNLKPLARIPVSRGRAIERSLFRIPPGAFLIFIAVRFITSLNFRPSGATNRITEYSLALIMLAISLIGFVMAIKGVRWLALALWPTELGILADADALTFRLGPFGTMRYSTGQLDVRYAFERDIDTDDEDSLYESLLEPEVQMASFMPRIGHPDAAEPLENLIKRYAPGSEKQLAGTLRPFTNHMRRDRPPPIESGC